MERTLPKCAAIGCDNTADPRMWAHTATGSTRMVCDGCSPVHCPVPHGPCACPALRPEEPRPPLVDWQSRATAAEAVAMQAAHRLRAIGATESADRIEAMLGDGTLVAEWRKFEDERAAALRAAENERDGARAVARHAESRFVELSQRATASERRAEEAEGLLRRALPAVDIEWMPADWFEDAHPAEGAEYMAFDDASADETAWKARHHDLGQEMRVFLGEGAADAERDEGARGGGQ